MIDRIIRFSIENKVIVGSLVLGLIGWGIFSLTRIPIDAVPDITDNQIQIITTSPSLAAQEVEQYITFPLEMQLGNVPGVVEVRSVSRFGLSVITVVFEEDVDIYLARQLIGERIQAAEDDIPEGFGKPEMGPMTTGLGEIFQYVIYPEEKFKDKYSSMDLRTIQDWVVKRQLVGIKGVIEVNSMGGFLKQYEIAVNPEKLKSMKLSLPEVFEAVARNNSNIGGSYIEKEHFTYFIRGEGLLKKKEEIENVVVRNNGGLPILVKDIATVQYGHAPRFGAVTMNGKGEVVAGQVLMLKGENAASVTQRVKERLDQIRQSLPEGIVIEPYLDRTKLVNRTTNTVATNLIEGGLIVIFVLVLLLGNFRAGLIVASVIPLSMLFAVSLMQLFGVSANLMSLGAIDFGLIVDGAVIIIEAIMFHLSTLDKSKTYSGEELNNEIFTAASRTRKAAAFGEIIILIVYLPILFLVGIEGKMFRPMAQTVSFAILGALLLSLTYVPMMASLFLKEEKDSRNKRISDAIINSIYRLYHPVLEWALNWKKTLVFVTVLLFGVSLWVLNRMGGEFIPTLEEGDFALHQILPPGSSIAQGVEVSDDLQLILMDKFPEVEKVVTKIGTAEIPTDIMPLEAGDIYVILKPKDEWTSAETREELFEKMEEEMNKFPGVIYEFTQPIQMRFNELMTGIRQDIAIKIFGENLGELVQKANQAKSIIEGIEGVSDIQVEPTAGLQQMYVEFDRRKIAKYGLSIETISHIVRGAFAGEKVGILYEGEKRFDIVVRLEESHRQEITDLAGLYIPLENGDQIPLNEVAKVSFTEGPTQISRENTQRRITIGVNARGRDVESLVKEIETELDENLNLQTGYYTTFGGQFENLENARARLRVAIPIALALIFLLLYLTFNSLSQTLLIFTAIPMSAIGGIWALYLRSMPFSISAGVGFIALFGVAVLNGIVLIAYLNQLKDGGMSDIKERIIKGTKVRLRPVIMTAAVASLGFLPMAISTEAGAEVQQPLATVVIGGLLSATFLTLIILPILYWMTENRTRVNGKGVVAIVSFIVLGMANPLQAQNQELSLNEAIELAKENYPTLLQRRLAVEQQEALLKGPSMHPRANLYFSGEEIGSEFSNGNHAFGLIQSFNLPKVKRVGQKATGFSVAVANSRMALSEKQLTKAVSNAYYQLTFAKQKVEVVQAIVELYDGLVNVSDIQNQTGEIGKMPLLTAKNKLSEARLFKQQADIDVALANQQFNNWLFADSIYDISLKSLPETSDFEWNRNITDSHPFVRQYQQQVNLASANIEVAKSKLLPQIQLGGQIQTVGGGFPFWGYQVGLNFPLLRKYYTARVDAAKIQQEVNQSQLEQSQRVMQNNLNVLIGQMEKERSNLAYLKENLVPTANEQVELGKEAFLQGEITYLAYVQTIDQALSVRMRYLESLLNYQILLNEWEFWQ